MNEPHNLTGRHKETLRHVFSHPMSHNVEWRQVLALLREVADVDERPDGHVEVRGGGQTLVVNRSHAKDVDPQDLEAVRHLLEAMGLRPPAE